MAAQTKAAGADPLGSKLAVHQQGLGGLHPRSQSEALDEPTGGNCHHNAVAESFFSSLKHERIRRRTYKTRDEARQDVFDYIEMFYNPVRKQVRNGMLSPAQFERQQILKAEGV